MMAIAASKNVQCNQAGLPACKRHVQPSHYRSDPTVVVVFSTYLSLANKLHQHNTMQLMASSVQLHLKQEPKLAMQQEASSQ